MFGRSQRGAISIYITLLILLMVTSSAIILSSLISRQIRISEEIIASERSFYAAGSGLEEALYYLLQSSESEVEINEGVINYPESGEVAEYTVTAASFLNENQTESRPCVNSQGNYRGNVRRIRLQSPGDEC